MQVEVYSYEQQGLKHLVFITNFTSRYGVYTEFGTASALQSLSVPFQVPFAVSGLSFVYLVSLAVLPRQVSHSEASKFSPVGS